MTDGAHKADAGKAPWHLLPGDALGEVVKVLQLGAEEYGERNWEKGMDWNRPFSALMRHSWAWWGGQDKDPDSGLSHLAHAICCLLFLLSYTLRKTGTDNRPVMQVNENAKVPSLYMRKVRKHLDSVSAARKR